MISTKAHYKFRPVTISGKESPLRQHTGSPLVIMQHNQPTPFGSRVLGVPGDYEEITFGSSTVSASSEGIKDALGPRAFG